MAAVLLLSALLTDYLFLCFSIVVNERLQQSSFMTSALVEWCKHFFLLGVTESERLTHTRAFLLLASLIMPSVIKQGSHTHTHTHTHTHWTLNQLLSHTSTCTVSVVASGCPSAARLTATLWLQQVSVELFIYIFRRIWSLKSVTWIHIRFNHTEIRAFLTQ